MFSLYNTKKPITCDGNSLNWLCQNLFNQTCSIRHVQSWLVVGKSLIQKQNLSCSECYITQVTYGGTCIGHMISKTTVVTG